MEPQLPSEHEAEILLGYRGLKLLKCGAGAAGELSQTEKKTAVAIAARPPAASAVDQDGPRIPASVRAQTARHEALAVKRGSAGRAREFNDPMDPVCPVHLHTPLYAFFL